MMQLLNSQENIVRAEDQVYPGLITYEYSISANFTRMHHNPPLEGEKHWHDFQVRIDLEATRFPTGLYGLNMVDVENSLKAWEKSLPEVVNDCPLCPHGTTEELCHYFLGMPLDPSIKIMLISVAETPNRVTRLRLI